MAKWLHFRSDFPLKGAEFAAPVLFGTAALSGVSAFATAKVVGGRSGCKVNRLHPCRSAHHSAAIATMKHRAERSRL